MAPGEWLALAGIAAVFILLRFPLFFDPALHLGWNSDAAIFGLMAKAIFAGRDFPIFFWGQSYMGPLTSLFAAAAGGVLRLAGVTPAVGPLALRIGAAAEVLAAIFFYWSGLRRAFDARTATVVALWLAIGPAYLFFFTIAPIGGEQMFVLSAIVFWFSVRTMLRRPRDWFVFGLLAGIGWWIHQGVAFAIGASVLIVVLRSSVWATAWREPRLLDRLLLRGARQRWRGQDRLLVNSLRVLNGLLLLWILEDALFCLGLPVPAFFLFSPLLEPLIVFVVVRVLLALGFDDDARSAVALAAAHWRSWLLPLLLAICGALVGYAPVIVGGMLHLYPRTYGLSVPPLPLRAMVQHLRTLARADFWALIGAGGSPAGVVVGAAVMVLLLIAFLRHGRTLLDLVTLRARDYGARGIAAATIVLCLIFYLTSRRAHEGSVRYVVSALPMFYAFAAREIWSLRPRLAGIGAAVLIALALTVPRLEQVRDVAAARSERYSGFGGQFDPRSTLHAIEAGGYSICYSEYWIAYKLQWVSEERVRFIPFHSFDRTPAATRALEAAPGRKCYVDAGGGVGPFNPREFDESLMHAARERLRRMTPSR
jgi:hypothetical protein